MQYSVLTFSDLIRQLLIRLGGFVSINVNVENFWYGPGRCHCFILLFWDTPYCFNVFYLVRRFVIFKYCCSYIYYFIRFTITKHLHVITTLCIVLHYHNYFPEFAMSIQTY